MEKFIDSLVTEFDRLKQEVIRPAKGFLKHTYLVPGGYYDQLWDWDGYYTGLYLGERNKEDGSYLKWWVLNFCEAMDDAGYVPGCLTTEGIRPLFGKFSMKPFLSTGAYEASVFLDDFNWIKVMYNKLKLAIEYRENSQFDEHYGLFYWENALQSGADNNPALTNDPNDKCAILGCDINTFQLNEYESMQKISHELGFVDDERYYSKKSDELKEKILQYLWFDEDQSFFNIRRDDSSIIKRISYSNFIPLTKKIVSQEKGRSMIKRYLWNEDHLLTKFGLRSLSKQDTDYNNQNIIVPYSNWQGPIWPVANYNHFIALRNYNFFAEAKDLAIRIGNLLLSDIQQCGTMHENYHAEDGSPLAPTAEQSKNGIFTGFVSWNLLSLTMLLLSKTH